MWLIAVELSTAELERYQNMILGSGFVMYDFLLVCCSELRFR